MTTSLVTGGAGFIGSHVAKHLLDMGHKVVVLDNLSGGFQENVPRGAIFHNADIRWDAERFFVEYRPDYVFHLAAYAAEGLSHFIRNYNYEVNVIGSVNLINAAVNVGTVKRFVFTSSNAVYGHHNGSSEWPLDPYAIAKQAVELDLQAALNMFDLGYTIFRLHNVYGEGQNLNDPYRNVVGIFMRHALRHEPFPVFGDGLQTRSFTYVGDVVPYLVKSITERMARSATIDLGSSERTTILALAQCVASAMGVNLNIEHLPARQEAKTSWSDNQRYYPCPTPLVEGIRRMAQWAKTQELRDPKPFTGIEIQKNLPESWRKLYVH